MKLTQPLQQLVTGKLASTLTSKLAVKVAGIGLLALAPGLFLSLLIEWGSSTSDGEVALLASAVICAGVGWMLWKFTQVPEDIPPEVVFATVAWTWLICSVFGSLPYMLDSTVFGWSNWDSALFESISGFSCTGSTVIPDLESVGRGMLMWRQITQWYGGMGMIVLAVSVLPKLQVGGLELIGAEAPGDSDRLEPRVRQTARWLWYLYSGVTLVLAAVLFVLPKVNLYDAVAHAFSTAATGGFSPYNASIGHFSSVWVELVICAGLLACAVSFSLHYRAISGFMDVFRNRQSITAETSVVRLAASRINLGAYGRDADLLFYLRLVTGVLVVMVCLNVWWGDAGWLTSIRDTLFNGVSLATSGGFGNVRPADAINPANTINPASTPSSTSIADFAMWVPASQMLLLVLMVMGGNVGSTAGGLKAFRAHIALRHLYRNVRQSLRPRAVLPIRLGNSVVPEETVRRVMGYVTLFVVIVALGTTTVAALGSDLLTSLSGVVSAMSNMGPALGEAGPTSTFMEFTRPARLVLAALMLIGRLEIIAILLLLASLTSRWRK